MKKFLVLLSMFLMSCGSASTSPDLGSVPGNTGGGTDGKNGTSCSVTDTPEGLVVKCTDGTTATVKDGSTGVKGDKGDSGVNGKDGLAGAKGDKGDAGSTGADGETAQEKLIKQIQLVKQYESSIIDIECNTGRGSGFKTNNKVYTARHVVLGATTCSFYSGPTRIDTGAAVSWVQKGIVDLAEVTVSFNSTGAGLSNIPIDTLYVPKLGDFQLNLSFPKDLTNNVQYTTGFVVSPNVNNSLSSTYSTLWYNSWTTDYAAAGGSSGSPVFVDGKVVGIHVGGYNTDGLELNYVINVK